MFPQLIGGSDVAPAGPAPAPEHALATRPCVSQVPLVWGTAVPLEGRRRCHRPATSPLSLSFCFLICFIDFREEGRGRERNINGEPWPVLPSG